MHNDTHKIYRVVVPHIPILLKKGVQILLECQYLS